MSLPHKSVATIDNVQFINLTPLDINPLMSKCEIKVFYLGQNRNGSYIKKEVATQMAKTLRGAPIVGFYKQSKEDFTDHGQKITLDDQGVHFECMTKPYGFVAPDAQVWFKKFTEEDEFGNTVERQYLMTIGYLWTGQYEQVNKVFEDNGKPQSMELDNESLDGHWSKDYNTGMEFFIINDAIISKLCILGNDVEPCFEGSSVTAPEVSNTFTKKIDENFTKTLFTMMKELEFALQGGNRVDGLENNIVNSLYGFTNGTNLMVAEDAIKEACAKDEKTEKFDTRLWVGCQTYINSTQAETGYYCLKYHNPDFVLEGQGSNRKVKYADLLTSVTSTTSKYNNWIIYRTADVLLIKAEALACKKETAKVKPILNAIYRRSYCDIEEGKQPAEDGSDKIAEVTIVSDWTGKKATTPKIPGLVKSVMNQRQLEFIGEGKRWFDLVRCAERYCNNNADSPDERENPEGVQKGEEGYVGNGMSGMTAIVECFMQNSVSSTYTTLINRFKNRWGLYCPIYEKEVKASRGVILQNPVWNKSRYEQ